MNERQHWNNIAGSYEDEIFDVFKSDKRGRLLHYFDKHASSDASAIDFGCGVGKAFPYLSPRFREVLATDISEECIDVARKRGYDNIQFKQADLTSPGLRFTKAHFGFCCNVVMLPEIEKNIEMLRNIQRALVIGGHGLFVVPSLESILYSSMRMMEWYRKEGTGIHKIPETEFNYYKGHKKEIVQGVIYIEGVPTKHYLEPELHVLFASAGLRITALEKIEYEWKTEFGDPPKWMKDPFPWDWLVESVRIK
jgi:SAM-dependent methyltransferase